MRYVLIDLNDLPHHGRIVNISGSGTCLRSDIELKVGQALVMEIQLPETSLPAIGKVVWTRHTGEGACESGVQLMFLKQIEERSAEYDSLDALADRLKSVGISSVRDD